MPIFIIFIRSIKVTYLKPRINTYRVHKQVEKIKTPKEKSKPYWNEENLALLMEEENNDEDFDNDHDNRDDNTGMRIIFLY